MGDIIAIELYWIVALACLVMLHEILIPWCHLLDVLGMMTIRDEFKVEACDTCRKVVRKTFIISFGQLKGNYGTT